MRNLESQQDVVKTHQKAALWYSNTFPLLLCGLALLLTHIKGKVHKFHESVSLLMMKSTTWTEKVSFIMSNCSDVIRVNTWDIRVTLKELQSWRNCWFHEHFFSHSECHSTRLCNDPWDLCYGCNNRNLLFQLSFMVDQNTQKYDNSLLQVWTHLLNQTFELQIVFQFSE